GGLLDAGLPGGDRGASTGKEEPVRLGTGGQATPTTGRSPAHPRTIRQGRVGAGARIGGARARNAAADRAAAASPAESAASPRPSESGSGAPLPAASRHGQETAAEHRSTGKGRALGKGVRKAHPAHPSRGARGTPGSANGGRDASKGKGQQSTGGEPAKAQPEQVEPPGEAKGKAAEGLSVEHGKDKAGESETSP
ncbi:MAG TPA: hypothetical protein VG898_04065, partial [Solirubrobacterales bacterium]|nr:hypothetical protein [Solirubrobacterales bacterium]